MSAVCTPTYRMARFVATLGRGPGRSRALTRDEAREAMGLILAGEADPHQVGALLMLLRFRGEDAEEITGLVEAMTATLSLAPLRGAADLDWPSYGAGRTRGAPWYLLSALALARHGPRVLMHGDNSFTGGIAVPAALDALGLSSARNPAEAAARLATDRFAYLPLRSLAPDVARLLGLRALLGLRSPVNTAVRLLDPAGAPAGVDGVFHPPYIAVHLGVAQRMRRPRLLILKGGGGEAERNPAKAMTAMLHRDGAAPTEVTLPAFVAGRPAGEPDDLDRFVAVWRGSADAPHAVATVVATIAAALLASGHATTIEEADDRAGVVWRDRHR